MTRKQRRFALIGTGLGVLSLAAGLVLFAMRDSIVFFYSPADISEQGLTPGTRIRLGGLVAEGSVVQDGKTVRFQVTDLAETIPVSFTGILPDLFREGQGVVAEGILTAGGGFKADTVLAKHDENYMPKEVADKLRERGMWKEEGAEAVN
jgi:cytochrome c-type biogenesis protein CcmE